MAATEFTRADRAVNPDTFGINLLGFAEVGIAVRQRPDIGAVEIALTAGAGLEDVVVLHPIQAIEVARRLIVAAWATGAGGWS